MTLTLHSSSPEQTEKMGFELGRAATGGLVVTLKGDLGAGKTLMTKGIARGLGVKRPEYVTSPTFTIHKVYEGRLTLNHIDLYRLEESDELDAIGLDEALAENAVAVVEWPDDFYSQLGADRLDIHIVALGEGERELTFKWRGPVATGVGERLIEAFA